MFLLAFLAAKLSINFIFTCIYTQVTNLKDHGTIIHVEDWVPFTVYVAGCHEDGDEWLS